MSEHREHLFGIQHTFPVHRVEPWVEVTLRLPQEEYIHPHLVRDDVSDALAKAGYEGFSATVTETSLDYGWHVRHRQETV